MQYRREIDGLRAVAVLPVILFHAGFSVFSGGYVGVDVFFVISGYLITSILISELEQGNFSILRFYERRARRILPALFVVMLACLPFAYMWMLPTQLKDFAQSLVAVVFFASNIQFWRESGYFASAAELKPLLHTWSLAVEEQYYLIFPVFLLLVWKFGRNKVFLSVVAIAVFSLLLSEWGWRNLPSANFYLAPTRAWELLAGSLCAFLAVGKQQRSNNLLSAVGLALIVFAIFYYDESTPFPSLYALAPVVGTALIILFAAQGTWTSRLLSTRGFVGIGLISYSAYLWHQPLFAFARIRSLTEPSHYLMAVLAVVAMLLAWATWRWVEHPFRKRAKPIFVTRRSVFAASCAVAAVFVLIGLAGHFGKGFEWRFDNEMRRFFVENDVFDREKRGCSIGPNDQIIVGKPACEFRNELGTLDVLLIGDSHSSAVSGILGRELQKRKISYYEANASGCLPLQGLRPFGQVSDRNCLKFNALVYEYAAQQDIKTIVLTARFPWYLLGVQFDNGEGGIETGDAAWVDLENYFSSAGVDEARRARVLRAYEVQIRKLGERFKTVLVYPIPEAGWNVPTQAFRHAYFGSGDYEVTTSYAAYKERTQEVNALFDRLVMELPNVFGARVHEILCSDKTGRCINADASGIYYKDDDHLSNTGTRLVAPTILEAVEAALGR